MSDEKTDFCEALKSFGSEENVCLFTVAEGENAGEKALTAPGKLLWCSDRSGILAGNEAALLKVKQSGLLTVSGVRVFASFTGKRKSLVICGAGHVSMPVIRIGQMLGFRVTVIDDRPYFADRARQCKADEVRCCSFEEALSGIKGDRNTYFVIVTRGHRYDKECLRSIAGKPHAYIGMIGSRRRTAIVKQDLKAEGISGEVLDSVCTPIGLDIGAETPEEIAVAIMAEIIKVKNRSRRNEGFTEELLSVLAAPDREPMVMALIISRKGSAPREAGTRMLIARDGRCTGTIGGGCAEAEIIQKGRSMLAEDNKIRSQLVTVDMTAESAEDEGMVCGGTIEVLLETV